MSATAKALSTMGASGIVRSVMIDGQHRLGL
jgi:hypothetical protein